MTINGHLFRVTIVFLVFESYVHYQSERVSSSMEFVPITTRVALLNQTVLTREQVLTNKPKKPTERRFKDNLLESR